MNEESKRRKDWWAEYLAAGPDPDDPFWKLTAEQEKELNRLVELAKPKIPTRWRRVRWWLRVPVNVRIWRYRLWFGHNDEFNDCG